MLNTKYSTVSHTNPEEINMSKLNIGTKGLVKYSHPKYGKSHVLVVRLGVCELDKYSIEHIVRVMLQMLNNIKLYHWNTFSYPEHKATDELYSSLGDNIDKFVEILLGKNNARINTKYIQAIKIHNLTDTKALKESVERYKMYLDNMPDSFGTDLLNIRDEILGDLNKFLYLLLI